MSSLSVPTKAITRFRLYLTATLLAGCLGTTTARASETEEPRVAVASPEVANPGSSGEPHASSPRGRMGVALLGAIVLGGTAAGVGLLVDPSGTNSHGSGNADKHLGGGILLGVSGACLVGVLVAAMYHPRPKSND